MSKPDLMNTVAYHRPEPREGDPMSVWLWHCSSRPTLEERREWLARCPEEFREQVRELAWKYHQERQEARRR